MRAALCGFQTPLWGKRLTPMEPWPPRPSFTRFPLDCVGSAAGLAGRQDEETCVRRFRRVLRRNGPRHRSRVATYWFEDIWKPHGRSRPCRATSRGPRLRRYGSDAHIAGGHSRIQELHAAHGWRDLAPVMIDLRRTIRLAHPGRPESTFSFRWRSRPRTAQVGK